MGAGKLLGVFRRVNTVPYCGIICGDPLRVELIGRRFFENPELLSSTRGFPLFRGTYSGAPVFIASTGIGAASAALILEELVTLGARHIIRLGTVDNNLGTSHQGHVFVVRRSTGLFGLMRDYGWKEHEWGMPLRASAQLTLHIMDVANHLGYSDVTMTDGYHIEGYYARLSPEQFAINPGLVKELNQEESDHGLLVSDMESAALFLIGSLRGAHVASILLAISKHRLSPGQRVSISSLIAKGALLALRSVISFQNTTGEEEQGAN